MRAMVYRCSLSVMSDLIFAGKVLTLDFMRIIEFVVGDA